MKKMSLIPVIGAIALASLVTAFSYVGCGGSSSGSSAPAKVASPGDWSETVFTTGAFANTITATGGIDVNLSLTSTAFSETFSTAAYKDWGVNSADWNTASGALKLPATNIWGWSPTTSGAPSGRRSHSAVWTGEKMIIWGGENPGISNTGGIYDPATDSWGTEPTTTGAPAARSNHSAVWTGEKMIIWGGYDSGGVTNTGGIYDPATDS